MTKSDPEEDQNVGSDLSTLLEEPWYWTELTAPQLRTCLDDALQALGPLPPARRTLGTFVEALTSRYLGSQRWRIYISHRPAQTPLITVRLRDRSTTANEVQVIRALCYWSAPKHHPEESGQP